MYLSTKKQHVPYSEQAVRNYMIGCLEQGEHIDRVCGSVNVTALAEDACQHFDASGPAPTCACPEEFFEWSFQIGSAFEDALDDEEACA